MSTPQTAEFGFWKSPITSDLVAAAAVRLGQIAVSDQGVYWSEGRPAERGRNVIVQQAPGGERRDILPEPFNARTRVHEYGGGAFLVSGDTIYFSNDSDQRLYHMKPGAAPQPLTPEAPWRYADSVIDSARGRLICVREDHGESGREPRNMIVSIDVSGDDSMAVLVSGSDFYSNPRLSSDGAQLAWMSWNHPNMPWDGCELWVASIQSNGQIGEPARVAGGPAESIFQPEWSPDRVLYFVSDRSGWWNLYRAADGQVQPVVEMEAEFGLPQWVFGQSTYAFESPQRLVCTYHQQGSWRLAAVDVARRQLQEIETPYTDVSNVRASPGRVTFRGGSPTEPASIVQLDLETERIEVLRQSFEVGSEIRRYFSVPEAIEFPTENDLTSHGLYYPAYNPEYTAPSEERSPLIVVSHGGPTGATSSTLSLAIQYWTSRGFSVLDVNYGGSTGYGRAYRERLQGKWGIVDVDDCVNGAQHLARQGAVDPDRLVIRGGSAGGYTTLAALTFRDVFRAGASYYGVSDLEGLARETHKFESRYLDSIVGPYPESRDIYRERSPIHFVQQLNSPIIFFQGSEDKVVPPDQAEGMLKALRKKGIPVSYLLFDGEQHGFRRAENIKRCLDAELYFYAAIILSKGLQF